MKTISIRIPAIPHHDDIIKALAVREELNKPFTPIAVPRLRYPVSRFKPASLHAFISSILP